MFKNNSLKRIDIIIVFLAVLIIIFSCYFINKLFDNDNYNLENTEKKLYTISSFALLIETDDDKYEEVNNTKWPTDMVFNAKLSNCIDIKGNKIDNSLVYDNVNNLVTVNTNKTCFCYIYFDKKETIVETIINTASNEELIDNDIENGDYRYVGTDPNNYICFGTSDKNKCVKNQDEYMYRIIGIFADKNGDKHIKLIKNSSIGTNKWHNINTDDILWTESDLYKGLNGITGGSFGNLFINNSSYDYMKEDSEWYNKILMATWTYGDETTVNMSALELYNVESNWSKEVNAKIGLVYVSDYFFAYQKDGLNCSSSGDYNICKNSWLYLGSTEWTMSRYGYGPKWGYYNAWTLDSSGSVYAYHYLGIYDIRPVFYLENNIEFSSVSGKGEANDPFVLKSDIE